MRKRRARRRLLALLLVLAFAAQAAVSAQAAGGANWTSTNADSGGTNHVEQSQITAANVNLLQLQWQLPFSAANLVKGLNTTGQGSIAPPLVVEGVVYVTMNDLEVMAVNAETSSVIWTYQPALNTTGLPVSTLVGHVHGATYHDGKVWVSLPDCSVVALDAVTGSVARRITGLCTGVAGNGGKYDYSGTPVVFYKDLMVWTASSVSEGTDAGRGFVLGYNLTSQVIWRWYAVPPAGGDPNWDSDSCPPPCHGNVAPVSGDWGNLGTANGATRAGAGPGWGQPAVDVADGLVILGTSQPSPDWNATFRPGPNLYSDSVIALNPTNGRMAWFYQTTPHDLFDFDCGWNVALGSAAVGGQNHTVVFKACKNGYLYAIDARSGGLLWYFSPPNVRRVGTANANYVATGTYDPNLRWIDYPFTGQFEQCPGVNGAVESDIAVAYGKVFVATHNLCSVGTIGPVTSISPTTWGIRSIVPEVLKANTTVYGLDESTGRPVWSYYVPSVPYRGWLAATGGMVFASTLNGDILALDASSGTVDGRIHIGASLYEGVTLGSAADGTVYLFQLLSSPSYGAFSGGVPGSLLAYSLTAQQPLTSSDILPWLLVAALSAVVTVLVVDRLLDRGKREPSQRESDSGQSLTT